MRDLGAPFYRDQILKAYKDESAWVQNEDVNRLLNQPQVEWLSKE